MPIILNAIIHANIIYLGPHSIVGERSELTLVFMSFEIRGLGM